MSGCPNKFILSVLIEGITCCEAIFGLVEEVRVVGDVAAEAGQLDGGGRGRHRHARAARVAPQALLHGQLTGHKLLPGHRWSHCSQPN